MFYFVKETQTRVWGLKGGFDMTMHGEQTFIFKFRSEEDREKVLNWGPLHIASRLFIIRPWRPFIEEDATALSSIPIWVNLRNVPLIFWDPQGLELYQTQYWLELPPLHSLRPPAPLLLPSLLGHCYQTGERR